jgi:sugar/nucleoside kinase (ribokinase family)
MFVAGCCFDELPPAVIMEAVHSHRSSGGAVFFDPGPRSLTFRDPARKKALHAVLDSTDVVLMTQVSYINGNIEWQSSQHALSQDR